MYTPLQLFLNKKFEGVASKEAVHEWTQLSDKKRLKYIKKAERKYDANEEVDKNPFHTFLDQHELELLFKSYDLPPKPPLNSRMYYINRFKDSASEEFEDKEKLNNEAALNWLHFSKKQKAEVLIDYHKACEEFEEKLFDFIRNLPAERVQDCKYFLSLKKPPNIKKESQQSSKRKRKTDYKEFIPFEIFIRPKLSGDHEQDDHKLSRADRSLLRKTYSKLPDDEKLKLIKRAEQNYDSYEELDGDNSRPLFSTFLTKIEVNILFDSYGMPEKVPSNLGAYFMKKMYESGTRDVKKVFQKFREQTEEERKLLIRQHTKALEEYVYNTRRFLDKLPKQRINDYHLLKNSTTKKTDQVQLYKKLKLESSPV